MAKYDEFGRPIYETAEEYNKAHKTGGNSRTYDSPEGSTYKHNPPKATKVLKGAASKVLDQANAKSKKSGKPVLVVLIFMAISLISTIFSMFNMTRDVYETIEDIEEDAYSYEETNGDGLTPLPDGFEYFSYNGQTYSLPSTYEEIKEMGFTLEEEYDEDYMLPMEYEEMIILNGEDGFMSAIIRINNYTDEEIPLEESLVDYFYIENPAAYDEMAEIPDFVFCDGLTFESTYEELEAYFGTPFHHYHEDYEDGSYFDRYEWSYYGNEEIHHVVVTFWNEKMQNVGIEKKVYEDKY